jgi:Bacteriophage tail sheath protein
VPVYSTPGVYFEQTVPPAPPALPRTDIAGFVGLAERGPLDEPRRLEGWREFQRVFGGFLPYSNLAYAVRAFFENGGSTCVVVRVADRSATSAVAELPGERGGTAFRVEALDPGAFGNRLEVSVLPASRGSTEHLPAAGLPANALLVRSVAGFAVHSLVRVRPPAAPPFDALVEHVDHVRGALILRPARGESWPADPPFDAADEPPIGLETREFTIVVRLDGQVEERFSALAPHPADEPPAERRVADGSRLIRLQRASERDWDMPRTPWRASLAGGSSGLAGLTVFDQLGRPWERRGLALLEERDEVGILAMPDLCLRPRPPAATTRAPEEPFDECDTTVAVAHRGVTGQAVDAATGEPLAGAVVTYGAGTDDRELTGRDGVFLIADRPVGRELRLGLSAAGYLETARSVFVGPGAGAQELGPIELEPLDLPPALSAEDIWLGQAAMIAQCERLRDRFALIDAPPTASGAPPSVDEARAWRARFDTPFAAVYHPWLVVRDPLSPAAVEGRTVPPSGHVAGVYAATDLAEGVFRAPANRMVEWTEDLTEEIGDVMHGVLNELGINAIRALPGRGIRVMGARTTCPPGSSWRFVSVRRLVSMIGEAAEGLAWAVFEPNDAMTRAGVRLWLTQLLDGLWRSGALAGDTAEAAYEVRCDELTTTEVDAAGGRLIAELALAPVEPYEFVVVRLGVSEDELQVSEV